MAELQKKATESAAQEGGKQAGKTVTDAVVNASEALISHTVTAKRAAIISILNQSDLTLDHPRWEMKHGHATSDGIPPDEILPSSSQRGINMTFVKPRVSVNGCEGVLLYRYDKTQEAQGNVNCYLAIKFTIPTLGKNCCTIALLSKSDLNKPLSRYDKFFNPLDPKLYTIMKEEYFKDNSDDIRETTSKSGRWMEVSDTTKNVLFGCAMSGEDNAMIKVKISKINQN